MLSVVLLTTTLKHSINQKQKQDAVSAPCGLCIVLWPNLALGAAQRSLWRQGEALRGLRTRKVTVGTNPRNVNAVVSRRDLICGGNVVRAWRAGHDRRQADSQTGRQTAVTFRERPQKQIKRHDESTRCSQGIQSEERRPGDRAQQ